MENCEENVVIIPAWNEEKNIGRVIQDIQDYYIPIILVDDASRDQTAKIASDMGCTVITHKHNLGYADAINSGLKKAVEMGYKRAATLDADGELDPRNVKGIFESMSKYDFKLFIGIRSHFNRFSEKLFSFYTKKKWAVEDPLCGLKAYDLEVFRKRPLFETFPSIGTDLALWMIESGNKFFQEKIITNKRQDASRFGGRLRGNYKILKALFLTLDKHS